MNNGDNILPVPVHIILFNKKRRKNKKKNKRKNKLNKKDNKSIKNNNNNNTQDTIQMRFIYTFYFFCTKLVVL